MARIVLLDAGPLGLACGRPSDPQVIRCEAWLRDLEAAGVEILISEVADYETRRELLRLGLVAGRRRLDALQGRFDYLPINTTAMRNAAQFWAHVRSQGLPTAHAEALDADCIIAGQALTAAGPGDTVTIATLNVGHFGRFPGVDARDWLTIA